MPRILSVTIRLRYRDTSGALLAAEEDAGDRENRGSAARSSETTFDDAHRLFRAGLEHFIEAARNAIATPSL